MMEKCPYDCKNKTEYGYCKTTVCINLAYQGKRYGDWNFVPKMFKHPCQNCPNNPRNGGSGICHCVLGTEKFY